MNSDSIVVARKHAGEPRALVASARRRRAFFFALVIASTGSAAWLMADVVGANGTSLVEAAIFVLFTLNFAWIAMAFWTAAIGFVLKLLGRDPTTLGRTGHAVPAGDVVLTTRTALVMPIYNEDTQRVFAGIEAMERSLAKTAHAKAFDLFVLSDTTDPEIAREEEKAFRALRHRVSDAGALFYRRREQNEGRKAGNLAEFVRRWGLRYDHMVVLDADSVVSGERLVDLAARMQANPQCGIIQTLPLAVGRDTLFGRAIQFACRLNAPMLIAGACYWQLFDGNYWGHNAIIRTQAFAEHCGLPTLPGKGPLGGEILSHDFVEAAFMLRAGYSVWMLPDVGGSYEEVPPNVIDYAKRDRRWCQGNLQHLFVLPASGLRPLSRLYLLCGVMAYLSSPLWLTLLVLSTLDVVQQALVGHSYFGQGRSLFPSWPISKSDETISLFAVTMAMLLLPKVFGVVLALVDKETRKGFGGALAIFASTACELVFSSLMAPVMMLFQSRFVTSTFLGNGVSWGAQPRGDRGVSMREALARHGGHALVGLCWGILVLCVAPSFFLWLLPVVSGLLSSVTFTMWTSRSDLGRKARAWKLFLTPEETSPPAELALRNELLERPAMALAEAAAHLGEPVPEPAPRRMRPQHLRTRTRREELALREAAE